MREVRELLRHFLAALAYRTQKAVRDAPASFGDFRAEPGLRTPRELVRHMLSVLGHARTCFVGGTYRAPMEATLDEQVAAFHEMLESLSEHLASDAPLIDTTPERMLQGPFSDAMTHAGQLAMLRRLAGAAVPPENFMAADIAKENLGINQPSPVSPDKEWPAPEDEIR